MKDRSEDINESTMGKTNNAQAGKNSHTFDRMTVILRKQLLPQLRLKNKQKQIISELEGIFRY